MRVGETLRAEVRRDIRYRDDITLRERTLPAGNYYVAQPGSGDPGHGGLEHYIFQSLTEPLGRYIVPGEAVRRWERTGVVRMKADAT
ncbi:MAG: hypothetical protein ACE5EM_08850 [Sphingomonadales bacterium]